MQISRSAELSVIGFDCSEMNGPASCLPPPPQGLGGRTAEKAILRLFTNHFSMLYMPNNNTARLRINVGWVER